MTYRITKDKFLNNEEQADLLVRMSSQSERDRLLLFVAMFTGARPQEVLNLIKGDVLTGNGSNSIYIRGIKGSDDRILPVPAWLISSLYIFIDYGAIGVDMNQSLFDISYSRMVQVWQSIRPPACKKSLKSLRHTFAIELYKQTRDLFLVKRALGHRCITNTMVYVDYVLSTEHLQEIKKVNFYGLPRE